MVGGDMGIFRGAIRQKGQKPTFQQIDVTCPAITPTFDSDLVTNGDMETGNPPTGWLEGSVTITGEADERTDGGGSQCLQAARPGGGGSSGYAYRAALTLTNGAWYEVRGWIKNVSAATGGRLLLTNSSITGIDYAGTSWKEHVGTGKAASTSGFIRLTVTFNADGQAAKFDDVSVKEIITASMLGYCGDIRRRLKDMWFACQPTAADQTQCGMVFNYADANNYVKAFVSYSSAAGVSTAKLWKCLGGTVTEVVTGLITYVAGAELKVRVTDGTYTLYYNGTAVGSPAAITETTLGTAVYGWSTYASNTVGSVAVHRAIGALSNTSETVTTVIPIDVVDGALFGWRRADGVLCESNDYGDTWAAVAGAPAQARGLKRLGDGEVLLVTSTKIYRSTGWSTGRALGSWAQVLAADDGNFIEWSVDAYDNVAIAAEYKIPYTDSRYVWVSTDYGENWTEALNLDDLYPDRGVVNVHWHGTCVDHVGGRLYVCQGDDAGARLIRYSDDNGVNWSTLTPPGNDTTLASAGWGVVIGTDYVDGSQDRLLRGAAAIEKMYNEPAAAWYGFARRSFRDPATGIVYTSFVSNPTYVQDPGYIFASDGRFASTIYSSVSDSADIYNVMAIDGWVIAFIIYNSTDYYLMRGKVP